MADLINGFTIEEVRKMDLFTYLSDIEMFTYDEAVETCLRYDNGFDYPDLVRAAVRRWIKYTN